MVSEAPKGPSSRPEDGNPNAVIGEKWSPEGIGFALETAISDILFGVNGAKGGHIWGKITSQNNISSYKRRP